MNDSEHNNDDGSNEPMYDMNDSDESTSEFETPQTLRPAPHHHTHTVALVLLSLATLAVIIAAVIIGTGVGEVPSDTPDDTVESDATPGSIVPVSHPEATEVESTVGLPEGIFVNEADVVRSYSNEFGPDHIQRIVIFNTNETIQDLESQYRNWLAQNNFMLVDEAESDTSVSLRAEHNENDERLVIMVNDQENASRTSVQLNYIVLN